MPTYTATVSGILLQPHNVWTVAVGGWVVSSISTGYLYIPISNTDDSILTSCSLNLPLFSTINPGALMSVSVVTVAAKIPPAISTAPAPTPGNYKSLFLKNVVSGIMPATNVTFNTAQMAVINGPFRQRNQGNPDPRYVIFGFTVADPSVFYTFLHTGCTMTTTEQSVYHTGLAGTQYIRDYDYGITSGVIEDPKTGQDVAADETVLDGYTQIRVAAENWDPRQRRRPNRKTLTTRIVWRP
jgi:hypothetical protein